MKINRTILLVDDNPDDVALALRAFRKSPVDNQVVVARDGVEALDYLLGQGPDSSPRDLPVFVLLDLKLPKMDGFDVLRRLRQAERTELLPVVVMTSSREDRDRGESYRLGANSYIRKPVDFDKFQRVVGKLGKYWLDLNEAPPVVKGKA